MPPGDDESTVAERPLQVEPAGSGFENPDSESTRAGESDAIRAAAVGFMTREEAAPPGTSGFESEEDSATRAETPLALDREELNPFAHGAETPPTEVPETPPSESLPSTEADWYTFTVPDQDNTLAIDVAGRPIVTVALTLHDLEGLEVPMLFRAGDRPGTVQYEAEVTPGATYRLRVEQPPSSLLGQHTPAAPSPPTHS